MEARQIEVFSHSKNEWFRGRVVEELPNDEVRVQYGDGLEKDLPVDDPDLRFIEPDDDQPADEDTENDSKIDDPPEMNESEATNAVDDETAVMFGAVTVKTTISTKTVKTPSSMATFHHEINETDDDHDTVPSFSEQPTDEDTVQQGTESKTISSMEPSSAAESTISTKTPEPTPPSTAVSPNLPSTAGSPLKRPQINLACDSKQNVHFLQVGLTSPQRREYIETLNQNLIDPFSLHCERAAQTANVLDSHQERASTKVDTEEEQEQEQEQEQEEEEEEEIQDDTPWYRSTAAIVICCLCIFLLCTLLLIIGIYLLWAEEIPLAVAGAKGPDAENEEESSRRLQSDIFNGGYLFDDGDSMESSMSSNFQMFQAVVAVTVIVITVSIQSIFMYFR